MSGVKAALNPFLLRYRQTPLEDSFRSLQSDGFSKHLFSVVLVLVAMNIARIVLYSTESKSDAEIGWSVSLLVVSLSLPCLLLVRKLKFLVVVGSVVVLYLTCVEWIVSFEGFFGFEVRAIIVALGLVNVYVGLFLFGWGWVVFLPCMVLGTLYLILRTNIDFDQQDVPSQLFTGFFPLLIVYIHQKNLRVAYFEHTTLQSELEKWRDLVTAYPGNMVVLDLQTVLYVNPAASEFLQLQDPSSIFTLLKSMERKDNPLRKFSDDLTDLISPTTDSPDISHSHDLLYTLNRDNGQQLLQLTSRIITWEKNTKAVIVTFTNVTKVTHLNTQEARNETAALISACALEVIKPGLNRASGELRLLKASDREAKMQMLGAYYGLYCIDDLCKTITGGELRLSFKNLLLHTEMTKLQHLLRPLFDQHHLTFDFAIDGVPSTVKLDSLRYRQMLCLVLHAVTPYAVASSPCQLTITPKVGQATNELILTVYCEFKREKPMGALYLAAGKLARKLGTEGLKWEGNRVSYSIFAGFVLERRVSEVSLEVPSDEANKGIMPPENAYGLLGKR